jgi:hypothetical protein
VVVGQGEERARGSFEIARQELTEGVGRVKTGDLSRPVQWMPDIVKPDHFAVGGVEERRAKTVDVVAGLAKTA